MIIYRMKVAKYRYDDNQMIPNCAEIAKIAPWSTPQAA